MIKIIFVVICQLLVYLQASPVFGHHLEDEEEFSEGFFREETITGDWNGLRSLWQERGWVTELEYSGNLFHNPIGGKNKEADGVGFLEFDAHLDLNRIIGWPHAKLKVDLIHLHGTDPSANLGTAQTVSSLEAPDQFRVFLAWVEQVLWDGRLRIRAGIYSLDTEFDFKPSANLFVNGAFGTGLDLSETGITGPAIFPNSALGMRLYLEPFQGWYLQGAIIDGVPGKLDGSFSNHFEWDEDEGYQIVMESGIKRKWRGGREFKAGVGSLIYTTDIPDLVDVDAEGNPITHSETYGVYGFIDLPVTFERANPSQGMNLFFRLGTADPDVSRFDFTVTAGAIYTGLIKTRPEDVVGIGVSGAWNSSKFRASQVSSLREQEWVIETTYQMPLIPGLIIQPSIQYFVNPGSNPDLDNAFYGGMTLNVSF